jgi:hypothetical protein
LGIHGFSVVLVVGGTQATGAVASDTVPEAARKALADMKDFLPYKRYQLLDAAWILCCSADRRYRLSGRVRGPDGRDYSYSIDPREIVGSKLNLRFVMREVRDGITTSITVLSDTARAEYGRQHADAIRELDEARIQLRTMKQRFDVGTATSSELESATSRARRAEDRTQELASILNNDQTRRFGQITGGGRASEVIARAGGGRGGGGARSDAAAGAVMTGGGGGGRGASTLERDTMDSSFSISAGETVVIGTSRINGEQALIAILTAATKPGAAR